MSDAVPAGRSRRAAVVAQVDRLVRAIGDGDEDHVERAVVGLSQSRRIFAPLGFAVGAFVMLFQGLKLLVSNWRLALIQVVPAMWIWLAMLDLKAHVLRGRSFDLLYGPIAVAAVLLITAVTAASFFLNAVFAFAVATPGAAEIRPAFDRARAHLRPVLAWGGLVGLALGFAMIVVERLGLRWFAITTGIVIGVMMFCYVAVPARLVGIKTSDPDRPRRDKLAAAAVGGALGAVVCAPSYALGRVGILMLGSHLLFVPGLFVLTFAVTLQAGATGSVKAIKMSTKLAAGRHDLGPDPVPRPAVEE